MLKTMQTDSVLLAIARARSNLIASHGAGDEDDALVAKALASAEIAEATDPYEDRRRYLLDSAAHIVAEVERIDRAKGGEPIV